MLVMSMFFHEFIEIVRLEGGTKDLSVARRNSIQWFPAAFSVVEVTTDPIQAPCNSRLFIA